ncbi:MAG: class II glutamine amidotransferase, partial [bacterium]
MCRLLLVRSDTAFHITPHLQKLAEISKNSKEYQGHGWGCAYIQNKEWQFYKNIAPIWEDNFQQFGRTTLLMAHARSAFKDQDIRIENNMPFFDENYVFVFNGELRGVKIKETGRIGAEKIFNFIKRFDKGDLLAAMQKGVEILKKRTSYMKAMNFIISDKQNVYVSSFFNEDAEYFTMRYKR